MRISVYIATSLDGFIAREDGGLDFLDYVNKPLSGEDYGYKAFMAKIDALLMGRNTFEKVASFSAWPYDKPVRVMSQHLKEIPKALQDKAQLISGTLPEVIKHLEREGLNHVYLDGGKLIQSFLRAGLVSDLIITKIPILIGQGIPLFAHLSQDIKLEHIQTQSFASGLTQSMYRIVP